MEKPENKKPVREKMETHVKLTEKVKINDSL